MKFATKESFEAAFATMSAKAKLQITTLDLSETQVSDVTALAGLTNLTTLYLGGTQVSDVTALAGLTKLGIYR